MPLAPLPLASQSYEMRSRQASATRVLNYFAEKMPEGARSTFLLKPTPGLEQFAAASAGPVLAMAAIGGSLFFVAGDRAFRLQDEPGATPTDLGFVGTTDAFHAVSIAIGLTGIVFCVPPRAYYSDFDGTPFTELTPGSANFPGDGAGSVAYVSGFYVFSNYSGTEFFSSGVLSALVFDTLDWVRLSSQVDFISRIAAFNNELWLFGQNLVQVWYATGAADFPFRPRSGMAVRHGLGAPRTLVEVDGSMWWLGVDNVVYRSAGYQAKRVSDHALEEVLANYGGGFLYTASACGWLHEGHAFYSLNLPNTGQTFVFDAATGIWHERSSTADGTGRWVMETATQLSARIIFGSGTTGALYHINRDIGTEAGVAVKRIATLPTVATHGPRAFMARVEIEMEVGQGDAPLALDWSNDAGETWTAARTIATGADGATRTRVVATRLGSFRNRVLRLTGTGHSAIYGVDADIQAGTS